MNVQLRLVEACVCMYALWLLGGATATAQQDGSARATVQYRTAVRAQNEGFYEQAATEWTDFIQNYPNDSRIDRAYHYRGVCHLKLDKPAEAMADFQKVVSDYQKSELYQAAALYLGVTQFRLGQQGDAKMYDAALKTLQKLVADYPQGEYVCEALFYQGEALYAAGKKKEAAAAYDQVVQKFPGHRLMPDALYALGVAQEEVGDYQAAGQTYDRFLKDYANHELATEVGMRKGETLFAARKYKEAADRFAAAAAKPGFALADHATMRQAAALAQLKQYAEAAALYASLPEKFPQSRDVEAAQLAGGKCYYLAGDHAEAAKLLEAAIGSGGQSAAEAAHWLARCRLKQNQPAQALQVVEKALKDVKTGPWVARLMLDRADAVYETPDRRGESVALYAEVAQKHAQHEVAAEALYMAGFAALETGDFQAALKHAAEFESRWADHELAADVGFVAAEAALQLQKPADAEKRFAALLSKHPDHRDASAWKLRRALCLQLQGKHAETIQAAEPLVGQLRGAALAEAQYLIGSSQAELGRFDEALASLQSAIEAAPKWRQADETLLALAYVQQQLKQTDQAKATLQKLIADFPQSPVLDRAHYRLGEAAFAADDLKTAAAEYRQVLDHWKQSPLVPYALYGLGWAQLKQNDPAGAEKSFDRLLTEHADHKLGPRAHYARGVARQQLDKFAPAVEDLQALLAADPSETERSDARYVLGLCQVGLKQYDAAVATFEQLLKDDPDYARADKALYEWAWALKSNKKDKEAAAVFQRLADDHPDSPLAAESLYRVGEQAYAEQQYKDAADAYYAAMRKAGKSELGEKAAHKLGWAYFRLGELESAQKTFAYQAFTWPDGPLNSDAAFMEGECLFKQGKHDEALKAYARAKEPTGKYFDVLTLLHSGQAAAQLKQWDDALQRLSRCVTEFPDSPYLAEALCEQGWAQQNLGQLDEALKSYEQVIARTQQEVAARAQFLIGEIQFQRKQHEEAIKSFFKVSYGYGYPKWQADATFEAARCFEVLKKPQQAVKLYRELIEKFPNCEKAAPARDRLSALGG